MSAGEPVTGFLHSLSVMAKRGDDGRGMVATRGPRYELSYLVDPRLVHLRVQDLSSQERQLADRLGQISYDIILSRKTTDQQIYIFGNIG